MSQVFLAGYNVDADVLSELTRGQNRADVTPETISASYARISRDPRPINELRRLARGEVEKARRSNANIIFKMGHHSIAEHAVFNFDILGVSRLALEELEKFRLSAYTEKSQRYQKLEGNFVVPEEIRALNAERRFTEIIGKQNHAYQELIGQGVEPEDARYLTSMATAGQVGMTINARNLELLLRRFASHELTEVRELGAKMFELVSKIAPSIILFTAANDFDQKTYPRLRAHFKGKWERKRRASKPVILADYTQKADDTLTAALLHTSSGISFLNCRRMVKDLSRREREKIIRLAFESMEFYDSTLRELEHISLTYDLIVSAACFAQMKRHRMATITCQKYDPALGVTVPPKIQGEARKLFLETIKETEKAYGEIYPRHPAAAEYLLTGAHRKRILMTLNARELYHVSRLREDVHAQWEIRDLTAQMAKIARDVMPLTMLTIGGKDKYPAVYEKVFGHPPKVLPPKE